ncbi:MAG: WG repeat-containing protein [Bacteroidales bacterium]|nr:WG repeat-containing protein [Bacteroidales bacterium]
MSVMIDGKWGVVDSTRRIVVQPQFEDVDCYMLEDFGLAPAKINGKWGYVNAKGKWIIKPKFDWASKFYNSYTTIKLNERQGIINKKGKYYLFPSEPAFDDIEERDFDHLPYARISKRNMYNLTYDKIGLVDKKGNILIEPKFAKIKFFKGVIMAKEAYNGKWGIIDKRGNWIQKPIFIEIGNEYDWYYD